MSNTDLLPCEVNAQATCATCKLHNNGCPIETLCGVKGAYDIVKAFNPIKTTPKAGADIPALVKAQSPDYYDYFNKHLDWNDLDRILDFLYFHAKVLHIAEAQKLIDLIESNCEIKK